jgi:hypothetical protein
MSFQLRNETPITNLQEEGLNCKTFQTKYGIHQNTFFGDASKANVTAHNTGLGITFIPNDNEIPQQRYADYQRGCRLLDELKEIKRNWKNFQYDLDSMAVPYNVDRVLQSAPLTISYTVGKYIDNVEGERRDTAIHILRHNYKPYVLSHEDAEFIINRMFNYLVKTHVSHHSTGFDETDVNRTPLLYKKPGSKLIYNVFVIEENNQQQFIENSGIHYSNKQKYFILGTNEEVDIPYDKSKNMYRLDIDLTKIPN